MRKRRESFGTPFRLGILEKGKKESLLSLHIILMDTFEEAVKRCMADAREGDAVLLSPACASWGMFDDYEQRGRCFKQIVRENMDESGI